MKRIAWLALLLVAGLQHLSAQSFKNGIGIGIFSEQSAAYTSVTNFAFTYVPTFNFLERDQWSLAVSTPFSLGFSGESATMAGSAGETVNVNVMVQLPLLLNYNFGAGSSKRNQDRAGFFAGGGWAYHVATRSVVTSGSDESYVETSGTETLGPIGNVGARIRLGKSRHNLEFRLSYMKGLTEHKPSVWSFSTIFNF